MNSLLDLLFENIVFLLIAIGGLISYFKRISEDKQNRKGPDKTPPVFQAPLEEKQPIDFVPEVDMNGSTTIITPTYQTISRSSSIGEADQGKLRTHPVPINRTTSVKPPIHGGGKKVIDGIIWAEIIGPPRALKPYKEARSTKETPRL